jgi:hypothetical protein
MEGLTTREIDLLHEAALADVAERHIPAAVRKTIARRQHTYGLRILADTLDAHDELQLPVEGSDIPLSFYFWDADARARMAAAARALPCKLAKGVRENDSEEGGYFDMHGSLAGLTIKLTAYRNTVCKRVVTGTRDVTEKVKDPEALAAVPEIEVTRTEKTYKWECEPVTKPAVSAPDADGVAESPVAA